MNPLLIVVADGAKARLFTLETEAIPQLEGHPYLFEDEVMVNPEQDIPSQQLWSSPQSQTGHHPDEVVHSYDDRREHHEIEYEKRFAKKIAARIAQRIDPDIDHRQQLLLIADKKHLGLLRNSLIPVLPMNLLVIDLDKNLTHLSSKELQDYLVQKSLLPVHSIS